MNECEHLDQIREVQPRTRGCDSSKNKYATKHFHATQHPIIRSLEPGEDWGWCYVDQLQLEFV
jgi:hypothetical protein